jgi:hypothetical protein
MVPAKADWSFKRWLMKSRTPALPVAVLPVANAAVVVVLAAVARVAGPAVVAVVAPVVAMIVTMTPASPCKKKSMPVPILKPKDTIARNTAP